MGTAVYTEEQKNFGAHVELYTLFPWFVCDSVFLFYSIFLYF